MTLRRNSSHERYINYKIVINLLIKFYIVYVTCFTGTQLHRVIVASMTAQSLHFTKHQTAVGTAKSKAVRECKLDVLLLCRLRDKIKFGTDVGFFEISSRWNHALLHVSNVTKCQSLVVS